MARTSAALVTDHMPSSAGYSLNSLQWTGHSRRISVKRSWGGPSSQCSRSGTSTCSSDCLRAGLEALSTLAAAYWLAGQFLLLLVLALLLFLLGDLAAPDGLRVLGVDLGQLEA